MKIFGLEDDFNGWFLELYVKFIGLYCRKQKLSPAEYTMFKEEVHKLDSWIQAYVHQGKLEGKVPPDLLQTVHQDISNLDFQYCRQFLVSVENPVVVVPLITLPDVGVTKVFVRLGITLNQLEQCVFATNKRHTDNPFMQGNIVHF